jgi:hypothetical protein
MPRGASTAINTLREHALRRWEIASAPDTLLHLVFIYPILAPAKPRAASHNIGRLAEAATSVCVRARSLRHVIRLAVVQIRAGVGEGDDAVDGFHRVVTAAIIGVMRIDRHKFMGLRKDCEAELFSDFEVICLTASRR